MIVSQSAAANLLKQASFVLLFRIEFYIVERICSWREKIEWISLPLLHSEVFLSQGQDIEIDFGYKR